MLDGLDGAAIFSPQQQQRPPPPPGEGPSQFELEMMQQAQMQGGPMAGGGYTDFGSVGQHHVYGAPDEHDQQFAESQWAQEARQHAIDEAAAIAAVARDRNRGGSGGWGGAW